VCVRERARREIDRAQRERAQRENHTHSTQKHSYLSRGGAAPLETPWLLRRFLGFRVEGQDTHINTHTRTHTHTHTHTHTRARTHTRIASHRLAPPRTATTLCTPLKSLSPAPTSLRVSSYLPPHDAHLRAHTRSAHAKHTQPRHTVCVGKKKLDEVARTAANELSGSARQHVAAAHEGGRR
jgi:hypothetical protein